MMIRGLTVSLLFAVLAAPAYAQDSEPTPSPQDNPQTRQTDQSEDDYRRSQRRRGIEDIFEDIDINTRGSGSGTILGREVKAIDRLDQDSRRHLNKQRAKALAEAQPGEPIDAAYEPSEAAKSDEYKARQEKKAWDEMMREANSGLNGIQGQGGGTGGTQGTGQGSDQGDQSGQAGNGQPGNGQAGQSGQGQSGQGQAGQGQGNPSAGQPSASPLRGGSASSAASILDQIKGRSGSANRAGQQTGSAGAPSGSVQQPGQNNETGQAPQNASTQSGQSQNDAHSASDATAQNSAAAQAAAQNNAQSQSDAAAQAQAAAEAKNDAAHAAAHRDTISPLERLKRDPVERDDTGGQTSASDYLKRKKN